MTIIESELEPEDYVGFREIAVKIKKINPNRYRLQNNEFLVFGLGWLNSSTDAVLTHTVLPVY